MLTLLGRGGKRIEKASRRWKKSTYCQNPSCSHIECKFEMFFQLIFSGYE
jgi:hypothetical protein